MTDPVAGRTSSPLRTWFPHRKAVPGARARVFAIPYAGGSATVYRGWITQLSPEVELAAFEPPGRATRFSEKPLTRAADWVAALEPIIASLSDKPFVLFGHSMGALVAFELARKLEASGRAAPIGIVLSGHGPKDIRRERLHDLPTPQLIERLKKYNGTPPELLEHAELMELVLPTLRADFEVVATHDYDERAPVRCPMLVLGGDKDPEVPRESLDAWARLTHGEFALQVFEGDHFFLRPHEREVVSAVRAFVSARLAATP